MSKEWGKNLERTYAVVEKIQNQNGVSVLLRTKDATKIASVQLDINNIEFLLHT